MSQPATGIGSTTGRSRWIPIWLDRFLNPADAIGPVFVKEMRSSSRRFAGYGSRMAYVLILLGAFWLACEVIMAAATRSGAGRVEIVQRLQVIAPAISVAVLWLQVAVLVLTAPATTSSAFSDERVKRTLDALMTTPIAPWRIVLGKLASGVTQLFLLAMCSLPVLLAARVYGGLDWQWLLLGTGLTLSVATLGAMISLLFSMWVKKSSMSGFLGLIGVAILQGTPLLVAATVAMLMRSGQMRGGPPPIWILDMVGLSSVSGLVSINLMLLGEGGGAPFSITRMCLLGIGYSLACTAIIFLFSTFALRKVMLSAITGEGGNRVVIAVKPVAKPVDDADMPAEERVRTRRAAARARLSGSRDVGDQPVLWRELAQPLIRRPVGMTLALLVIVGFTAWVYVVSIDEPAAATLITTMVFTVIMLLQGAAATTSGIAGERDAKTWDTLLSTPLTARRIIHGKFVGALKSMWLMPSVVMANLILVNVIPGRLEPRAVLHILMVLPGPLLLLAASGTYLSLVSKSAAKAGTRNTIFAILIWGAVPLVAGILVAVGDSMGWPLLSSRGFAEHVIDVTVAYNPVLQMFSAVSGARPDSSFGGPPNEYTLGPGLERLSTSQFTAIIGFTLVGYVAATAWILSRTVQKFRKLRHTAA